jgi:hypothetical protein
MATNLSIELREGYRLVASSLSGEALAMVARARDLTYVSTSERSRAMAQILQAYRAGPRALWGPVVLDLLAPGLIALLQEFRPVPPVIDQEEIRQQLLLEVLAAVSCIPLHPAGRQTKLRILSRAQTRMLRWLAREGRRRVGQVSFDELERDPK